MKAPAIAAVLAVGAGLFAAGPAQAHDRSAWYRIYAPPFPYTEGWYAYETPTGIRRVYLPAYEKYSPSYSYNSYWTSAGPGRFPAAVVTTRYGRPYPYWGW